MLLAFYILFVVIMCDNVDMKIPVHVGIIMDGNGRWAKQRGLPRTAGHKAGAETLRRVVKEAKRIGIQYLSLYAFSTENWSRPESEVNTLMKLFDSYLDEAKGFVGEGDRIWFAGDKSPFPEKLRTKMERLEQDTKDCGGFNIILCMNYGGRDELVRAVREIAAQGTPPGDIDADMIGKHLFTYPAPDADLIIRTSGEMRLSNFLMWQSAYAEFNFTETLWPDFDEKALNAAIEEYSKRGRRFGGI